VVQFPVAEVTVGKRVRQLNEATVQELAQSIPAVGLLHPVTLSTDERLLAGLHRLEASKLLGWSTIPARMVSGEADELELVEIDENLMRAELTVLERAEHLERRRELYQARHPRSGQGFGPGRGHVGPQEDRAPSFASATSLLLGQSTSTIRRQLQLVASLPEEVRDLIRATPLADSHKELRRLAALLADEQRLVALRIGAGEAATVWEAQRLVRLADAQKRAATLGTRTRGYELFECHVSKLHELVPAQSVDLILTDPPYGEQAIEDYNALARFARHALVPNGSLLVMTGQSHLPAVLDQLTEHLIYQWTLAYVVDAGGSPVVPTVQRRVNSWWKPIIWCTPTGYAGPVHGDLVRSGPKVKNAHVWQQDAEGMEFLVQAFSLPGQLVCDPFVGTGTTGVAALRLGRRFVGADVDGDAVTLARARLSEVEDGDERT
jgi:ParB-like chromosome segregation protein Spo0J